MKDSTRQKYMDAMNRRADLIQQADDAFSSGEVEKGKELTTSAAALNPEIEGHRRKSLRRPAPPLWIGRPGSGRRTGRRR